MGWPGRAGPLGARVAATYRATASPAAYRAKIKKPSEPAVSAARALGASVDAETVLALSPASARIGEPLYEAQPPTGYRLRRRARLSPWAPLAVLFTDRGLRYTLLAALFFAPSVIAIKEAILRSDPPTGTLGGYVAASLIVTPLVLKTSRHHFATLPRHWKELLALGVFSALTTMSQGVAYTMTLSSYVEAVKQIEILFAMAIGIVAFGEKQRVRESLPGAVVMLLGMVLLSLAK